MDIVTIKCIIFVAGRYNHLSPNVVSIFKVNFHLSCTLLCPMFNLVTINIVILCIIICSNSLECLIPTFIHNELLITRQIALVFGFIEHAYELCMFSY